MMSQDSQRLRKPRLRTVRTAGLTAAGGIRERLDPGAESVVDLDQLSHIDQARLSDIRDRTVSELGYRPPYRSTIGETPKVRHSIPWQEKKWIARGFLKKIELAQDQHDGSLTHTERGNLRRLETIWARRAYGQDSRYLVMGTESRPPTRHEREQIRSWELRARSGAVGSRSPISGRRGARAARSR